MQHSNAGFRVPVGFRFRPTDCELVSSYLYNRVNGLPLPCGVIQECDLYGSDEPWEIWERYGGGMLEDDQDLYFFTNLKKKSHNGKRVCRRIGSGAWQGEDSAKEIVDRAQKVVGWRKRFRYENKDSGPESHNGAWLMHEYRLLGDCDQMVLCRMRKNIVEAAQGGGRGRKRKRNVEQSQEQSMPVAAADHDDQKILPLEAVPERGDWVAECGDWVPVAADHDDQTNLPLEAASACDQWVPTDADHGDQTSLLLEAVSECDHWVALEQLFPLTDDCDFSWASTSSFTDDDLSSALYYYYE